MATTAGALSQVSVSDTVSSVLSAVATGGTAPYTYQWYRSTTTGFAAGAGNLVSGATSLSLSDSGLTPGTNYFYKVIATDDGSVAGTSSQLAVSTVAAVSSQNTFGMSPILGQNDLRFNGNTLECQFDPAGSGTLVAGQAVKWSTVSGGVPKVVPSTATSDVCAGFVNYNIKNASYVAGDQLQISMSGNVIYAYAALAVSRGQQLTSLPSGVSGGTVGGVIPVTGSSGLPIVGWALDSAVIGSLMRVFVQTPSYRLDS